MPSPRWDNSASKAANKCRNVGITPPEKSNTPIASARTFFLAAWQKSFRLEIFSNEETPNFEGDVEDGPVAASMHTGTAK